VGHAELTLGAAVIAVGVAFSPPPLIDPEESRYTLRQMTLVYVDDVDAVVARAVAAGGSVVEAPTNQPWGLRQAIIRDPEGYLWEPAEHRMDVEPSAWGAELLGPLPG
jgi:PhnB protein